MEFNDIVTLLKEQSEIEIIDSSKGIIGDDIWHSEMASILFKYHGDYSEIAEFTKSLAGALHSSDNHWCYDADISLCWFGGNPESDNIPDISVRIYPTGFKDVYACLKPFLCSQVRISPNRVCI